MIAGEVLAMVGGRDFNLSQFNRATQAERQTGSSFKPYVYTAAVEEGARPEQSIVDAPATFSTAAGPYTPHNYDHTYQGTISLLHAFADSRNIPAVKLAERVGIRKVIATAHQFGLNGNIPPFLPIALGSAEVTLQEQVAAYSSFPNDGVRVQPHLIRKVTNADGLTLSESPANVAESTSVKTARIMMTFLKAVIAPGGTGGGVPECSITRWAARQAPPATTTTPGSSGFLHRSLAGCGSAMTTASRWGREKAAATRRCHYGSTS